MISPATTSATGERIRRAEWSSPLGSGDGPLAALNGGYHGAFLVGALFAVAAAVLGSVLLRANATTDAESATAPRADHDPKEAPM